MNITILKHQNNHRIDIQNELNLFAVTTGKQLGLQNIPHSYEEYNALFLNLLRSKIQTLMTSVEIDKSPRSQRAVAQAAQRAKEEKVRVYRGGLIDEETQRDILKAEVVSIPFTKWSILQYFCIKAIVLLLSFAESFLVYKAFRLVHIPTIGAIISSLAIGLGLTVLTDYVAHFIQRSKKVWIAWLRGICISLIMFLFFYSISLIRLIGMRNEAEVDKGFSQTPAVIQELPPYSLAFISTSMFVIGVLIVAFYGIKDKELFREYCKKWMRLRRAKRNITQIEKEINKAENDAFEICKEAAIKYDEADTSKYLLASCGNEAEALFQSTNLKYRTDGFCPPFYGGNSTFHKSHFSHNQNNNIQ